MRCYHGMSTPDDPDAAIAERFRTGGRLGASICGFARRSHVPFAPIRPLRVAGPAAHMDGSPRRSRPPAPPAPSETRYLWYAGRLPRT